jgi:hypothetical protein
MTCVPAFDDNHRGNAIGSRLSADFAAAVAQGADSFTLTEERQVIVSKYLRLASFSFVSCIAIWALMVISIDLAFNQQSEIVKLLTAGL